MSPDANSLENNELMKLVKKMNKSDVACDATACTVKAFFEAIGGSLDDGKELKVAIPNYQRDYAWEDEQLNQLFQDLRLAKEKEGEAYHLGTVILHLNGNRLDIVDGQQRLRTFDFLLNGDSLKLAFTDKRNDKFEHARKVCHNVAKELRNPLQNGTVVCLIVTEADEAFQLFETQNGRGKKLTTENLLKAYHYRAMTQAKPPFDLSKERLFQLEQNWEEEVSSNEGTSVLTNQLFYARRWARGDGKEEFETARHLAEYKGVTLGVDQTPIQNLWGAGHLLHYVQHILAKIKETECSTDNIGIRVSGEETSASCKEISQVFGQLIKGSYLVKRYGLDAQKRTVSVNPFVTLCQPIINGEDFFEYALTYARMYKYLFTELGENTSSDCLDEFRKFYKCYCLYEKKEGAGRQVKRKGDSAARTVYEVFVLLALDRFGTGEFNKLYGLLWVLAYYERMTKDHLGFLSAGETFGRIVAALLSTSTTVERVVNELQTEIKEIVQELRKISNDMITPFCNCKERNTKGLFHEWESRYWSNSEK